MSITICGTTFIWHIQNQNNQSNTQTYEYDNINSTNVCDITMYSMLVIDGFPVCLQGNYRHITTDFTIMVIYHIDVSL